MSRHPTYIHIRRTGRGPDLVLVHGWALNMNVWEPVTQQLAQDFRVTLVDLPGHGESTLSGRFTLDGVVESLRRVIPSGAALLGWSLGGMIGMVMAERYPADVSKLVLLASNPCFVATPERPLGMSPALLEQFAGDLITDYPGTISRFLAASTLGARQGPALLRQLMLHVRRAPPPDTRALQGGLEILRHADLRPLLAKIMCPTLVLLGQRDSLVPEAVGEEMMRELSNPYLRVFAGAGHAPFLSHPHEFHQALQEFAA